MAPGQAKEPSLQVLQGGEGAGFSSEFVLPMLENSSPDHTLDLEFSWPGGQPSGGVRKIVLQAEISQFPKPGFTGRIGRGEDDSSSPGEDIVAIVQPTKLSEQGKHPEVELGRERETAGHEEYHWSWRCLVEAEKSLEVDLVVVIQHVLLLTGENQTC